MFGGKLIAVVYSAGIISWKPIFCRYLKPKQEHILRQFMARYDWWMKKDDTIVSLSFIHQLPHDKLSRIIYGVRFFVEGLLDHRVAYPCSGLLHVFYALTSFHSMLTLWCRCWHVNIPQLISLGKGS